MFPVNHIYKMINPIKDYPWGSRTAIQYRYNIKNQNNEPQAEMWMGCHPNGSSQLVDDENNQMNLAEFIQQAPESILGAAFHKFGELPFLFKILAADKPLSIQVHPSKSSAEIGFAEENKQGILLSSPNRNFKDPNHKPELVYAITPFSALNGFRPFADILRLFDGLELPSVQASLKAFMQSPSGETLKVLFEALLNLKGTDRQNAVQALLTYGSSQNDAVFETIRQLAMVYPEDMGIFAPLLLNVVTLQPGEAMFLYAETPHAYLNGLALEVMANSDNVLRAGLTPKYIDIEALIANIQFQPKNPATILMAPAMNEHQADYPIPVDDFSFSIFTDAEMEILLSSAAVLFCEEGQYQIKSEHQTVVIQSGESVFLPAACETIRFQGRGQMMLVSSS